MTPRERVLRALNHRPIDRAPRDLWLLPGMEPEHADDVAEMNIRFPSDIQHLDTKWPAGKRTKGSANRSGLYTDAWGCTWQLGARGAGGHVVESPLAETDKLAGYELPQELLDPGRFARATRGIEAGTRFTLAWSDVRPLERLIFLRGPDRTAAELAAGDKDLLALAARLWDFFYREIEFWAATEVDGVVIHDDLAGAEGLKIPPKTWRQLFKPIYRRCFEILHARDKFALFRSEGQISEVFGDLIEVGADAIHAQLFLMDFEKLAQKHRGRVTFWGEIDCLRPEQSGPRQNLKEAVLRVRRALDFGAGGVMAQCSWGPSVPIRTVAAYFEEWMAQLPVNV